MKGWKRLYAPDGKRIKGTAETVKGTALIYGGKKKADGGFEIELTGETDFDWNTICTETNENGERLFVDENGGLWPESALKEEEDEKL